jgi:uncharacterized protein
LDDLTQPSPDPIKHDAPSPRGKRRIRWIFVGNEGIRWGWRLLLFVVVFVAAAFGLGKLRHLAFGNLPHDQFHMTLFPFYIGEGCSIVAMFIALLVIARIEHRSWRSYGLRGYASVKRFVAGWILGFAAVSLTVFLLTQLHVLTLDSPAGYDAIVWFRAVAWLGLFVMVAIFEETALRGYLQYTLGRGIGFWWSAILLSILFGAIHGVNPGETSVGLISAAGFGVVLCISLWYTGSLFWAIGFHAAWDWGESYFYGTSDSGTVLDHRFFVAHPIGNVLLSGGKTGPEGSVLVLVLLVVMALLMRMWWGSRTTSPFAGNGWRPARVR